MTLKQLKEGLEIFVKYVDDPSKEFVEAQHDQIWFINKRPMAQEDISKLESLGFFIDKSFEGWSHFT